MIELSGWVPRLGWSILTLLAAWAVGRVLAALVITRLLRRARVAQQPWASAALSVLGPRLPRWAVLVGAWIALGYWPLNDEAVTVLRDALFVAGATSVTLALSGIASHLVDAFGRVLAPGVPVNSLTRNVAWGLVATTGLLIVLNGLGLSIAPMLTALGVGGLAVALALQEPLANFFAGIFVTLGGQLRVGDYIRLDSGQEGIIADFSWRSTRVRMLANNLVVVPNAKLAQAIVTNHHLPTPDLAVLVEVGVDYASDLARVERIVGEVGRAVMLEVSGGVPAFEPFIRFHTFGPSSINFTVILRAGEFGDQFLVRHEFIKRLHARFAHEGVVIPFPISTIVDRRNLEGSTLAWPSQAPRQPAMAVPHGGPPAEL